MMLVDGEVAPTRAGGQRLIRGVELDCASSRSESGAEVAKVVRAEEEERITAVRTQEDNVRGFPASRDERHRAFFQR